MTECRLVEYSAAHAALILIRNQLEGENLVLPIDEMLRVYSSPGSVARTVMLDNIPIACGGIINLSWHRGEAWLLNSRQFTSHVKSAFGLIRYAFPLLACQGEFQRVQATSYTKENCALFTHLGFSLEAILRRYGPSGEDGYMFARFFEGSTV